MEKKSKQQIGWEKRQRDRAKAHEAIMKEKRREASERRKESLRYLSKRGHKDMFKKEIEENEEDLYDIEEEDKKNARAKAREERLAKRLKELDDALKGKDVKKYGTYSTNAMNKKKREEEK